MSAQFFIVLLFFALAWIFAPHRRPNYKYLYYSLYYIADRIIISKWLVKYGLEIWIKSQIVSVNWLARTSGKNDSKFQDVPNRTPMSGRIDPECNLICEFHRNNAFRRNDVPWLTRDRLFAALMTIPPRSTNDKINSTLKADAMKNRRRTRFARDIYFHIRAYIRTRYVHSRSLHERRNYTRTSCKSYARGASYTVRLAWRYVASAARVQRYRVSAEKRGRLTCPSYNRPAVIGLRLIADRKVLFEG